MKSLLIIVACFLHLTTMAQFGYNIIGNSYGVANINNTVCGEVDSCFTLTDNVTTQIGAVWDNKPINLNYSFDASFCMTLGSNDFAGADGFAFVIRKQGSADIGQAGSGLGFLGITPCIAIEFDTWENQGQQVDDIPADHTAMYINGDYLNPAVGATPLYPNSANVEDGAYHIARIVWNAAQDSLRMYFDGNLRMQYHGDLINSVFGGENLVLWGFTASTGGATNLQQICFPRYKINLTDVEICEKDSALIHFYDDNITSYKWTKEDGTVLKNWNTIDFTTPFNLNDTAFYVQESGNYILNLEINNQAVSDTLNVLVHPLPNKPFDLESVVYCPETSVYMLDALNPGSNYLWSTQDTTQQIEANSSGTYTVIITEPSFNCTNSDSITLEVLCKPDITIPNIFTPNGDQINDTFELIYKTSFKWIADFRFEISNRWGEVLYTVENQEVKWDGKHNGKELSAGVYFYTFHYLDAFSNEWHEGHGFIQLVK